MHMRYFPAASIPQYDRKSGTDSKIGAFQCTHINTATGTTDNIYMETYFTTEHEARTSGKDFPVSKMQQRLRQTDEELDNLIGVRSRAISRKLRSVQSLDDASAAALLELDNEPGRPVAARLPEG